MLKTILIYFSIAITSSNALGQDLKNKSISIPAEKISLKEGLPNHHIRSMIQDRDGFLWFGSVNGLFRYDGEKFYALNTFGSKNRRLQNNVVNFLFEDREGEIWIGTPGGLDKFNTRLEKTTNFKTIEKSNFEHLHVDSCLNTGEVRDIKQDSLGRLWIALYGGGINCYNPKTKLFTYYINTIKGSSPQKANLINGLHLTKSGTLWIATESSGILTMNIYSDENINHITSSGDGIFSSVLTDNNNQTWIGSWTNGLAKIDTTTLELNYFKYNTHESQNTIRTIIQDKNRQLWVATFRDGIYHFNTATSEWQHIIYELNNKANNTTTWSLLEDRSGHIWVGTWGDGIYKLNPNFNNFNSIYLSAEYKNTSILTLLKINEETIYLGTENEGLLKYNPKTNKITKVQLTNDAVVKNIRCLKQQLDGTIWIGGDGGIFSIHNGVIKPFRTGLNPITNVYSMDFYDKSHLLIGTHGFGLFFINCIDGSFKNYRQDSYNENSIAGDIIWDIKTDLDRNIWLATSNGLDKLDKKTETITHFLKGKSVSTICDLSPSNRETIWVGTFNLGVAKINNNTHKETIYPLNHNNEPLTILSLNTIGNKLWIGANNCIAKFNTESSEFEVFASKNSLINEGYSLNGALALNQEVILLGGRNGITQFNTRMVKKSSFQPKIFLTDLLLFNNRVDVIEKSETRILLDSAINQKTHLVLNYNHYMFTIDFGCDDFSNTENITYAYKLEGFDDAWTYTNYKRRYLSYTNLKPGYYQLKIKSTNSDGVWADNTRLLTIEILPPFWKTWWAYIIYIFTTLVLLIVFKRTIQKREKIKNELIFRVKSSEQKEEAERLKLNFFTNLSHEFRTPLTIILGTLEHLSRESLNQKVENQLSILNRNSNRLLHLINQILDLSKIDSAKMVIEPSDQDIVKFTSILVENLNTAALKKEIDLSFKTSTNSYIAIIDFDKFEKILSNIISNAIKYTNPNGSILVSLELSSNLKTKEYDKIIITIEDSGIGIAEDKLPLIFNRFYQVENGNGGTGIGLAYTKELVELLKGEITVESQPHIGSKFTISLPITSNIYIIRNDNNNNNNTQQDISKPIPKTEKQKAINNLPHNGATILIAEDDSDMRQFIISSLESTFKIIETDNGKTAWFEVINTMPDIVISDLMMPEKTGIELCKLIKTNEQTSHIPVILLTAIDSEDYRVKAFTDGADIYIAKPFNSHVLNAQVISLLNNRNILKDRFLKRLSMEPAEFTTNKLDQEFFFRISNIIENNLSDHNLNVDFICNEMSISKTHLYTKIKAITGQSGSEFIKILRLKYAALLIKDGHKVSKVYSEVGFKTQPHFTRAFKEYFEISPSDYGKL